MLQYGNTLAPSLPLSLSLWNHSWISPVNIRDTWPASFRPPPPCVFVTRLIWAYFRGRGGFPVLVLTPHKPLVKSLKKWISVWKTRIRFHLFFNWWKRILTWPHNVWNRPSTRAHVDQISQVSFIKSKHVYTFFYVCGWITGVSRHLL